ncbi:GtrA family protein [Cohnella sp. 56]|uniref:GtrA family protein n=1 Tax=Cohnella sp. 56 TaxID=3113722 RepID=UPI0030E987CD
MKIDSLEVKRVSKFAAIGVLNTGIDIAIFALLVYALSWPSLLAQCVSYFLAFLNSYWWNRRWTFGMRERGSARELLKFGAVNAASFLCATGVLLAAEQGVGLTPIAAKLVSVAASLAVNYAGSKLWVFRQAELGRGK